MTVEKAIHKYYCNGTFYKQTDQQEVFKIERPSGFQIRLIKSYQQHKFRLIRPGRSFIIDTNHHLIVLNYNKHLQQIIHCNHSIFIFNSFLQQCPLLVHLSGSVQAEYRSSSFVARQDFLKICRIFGSSLALILIQLISISAHFLTC